jgi:transketolase
MSFLSPVSPAAMRRIILTESHRAGVGHIGSCLSVVEIIASLYTHVLRAASPSDSDRDRFVLSKGHAALALYAALLLKGWITSADLATFCGDETMLGVHPEHVLAGVDFSTGSLGHGLSVSAGVALAARLQRSTRRAFCLLSDGECNEGSVWEAAMFAGHQRLGGLTAVVDVNGQQAFGLTSEVLDSSNLAERWAAFGWRVSTVDGHDVDRLTHALSDSRGDDGAPHVVLARTVFGKGVSFMERGTSASRPELTPHAINWHYLPMSADEFAAALAEVDAG